MTAFYSRTGWAEAVSVLNIWSLNNCSHGGCVSLEDVANNVYFLSSKMYLQSFLCCSED